MKQPFSTMEEAIDLKAYKQVIFDDNDFVLD
jgi:hypothetical protein